jgi:hypothetical protein
VYYGSTADPEERQAAHANGLGAQVLKGAIVGPFRVLGLGSLVAELLAVVMAVSAAVGTWWRRTDAKRPLPGTLVRGAFVAGAVVTAAARGLVGRLVAHLEAHGRFSLEGILTGIQNGGQNPFGGDLLRQYLWSAPWPGSGWLGSAAFWRAWIVAQKEVLARAATQTVAKGSLAHAATQTGRPDGPLGRVRSPTQGNNQNKRCRKCGGPADAHVRVWATDKDGKRTGKWSKGECPVVWWWVGCLFSGRTKKQSSKLFVAF